MAEECDSFEVVASALAPLELSHIPNVKRDLVYEIGNVVEPLNGIVESQREQLSRMQSRTDARCASLSSDMDLLSRRIQSVEKQWQDDKEVLDGTLENITGRLKSLISSADSALQVAEQARTDGLSLVADIEDVTNRIVLLEQDMSRLESCFTKQGIAKEVSASNAVSLGTPDEHHALAEYPGLAASLYRELQEARPLCKKGKSRRRKLRSDDTIETSGTVGGTAPSSLFAKVEAILTFYDGDGGVLSWFGGVLPSLSSSAAIWKMLQYAWQWLLLLRARVLDASGKKVRVLCLTLAILGAFMWRLTASYYNYLAAQEDWDL